MSDENKRIEERAKERIAEYQRLLEDAQETVRGLDKGNRELLEQVTQLAERERNLGDLKKSIAEAAVANETLRLKLEELEEQIRTGTLEIKDLPVRVGNPEEGTREKSGRKKEPLWSLVRGSQRPDSISDIPPGNALTYFLLVR